MVLLIFLITLSSVDDYFGIFLLILAYLCLLTTKVVISILLLAMAHAFILTDQQRSGKNRAISDGGFTSFEKCRIGQKN